jgi:hypothetical protein
MHNLAFAPLRGKFPRLYSAGILFALPRLCREPAASSNVRSWLQLTM